METSSFGEFAKGPVGVRMVRGHLAPSSRGRCTEVLDGIVETQANNLKNCDRARSAGRRRASGV